MSEDEMDMPRGVISRKARWEGEQMELEHQKEAFRDENKSKTAAAVDIRQFQNHVVGEGYQARHVVRQPTAAKTTSIRDMTGGASMREENKTAPEETKAITANMLLENDGLRAFRREIENLLE